MTRSLDGVKSVKNLLQVVPESMTSKVDARDEDITKAINEPSGRQIDRRQRHLCRVGEQGRRPAHWEDQEHGSASSSSRNGGSRAGRSSRLDRRGRRTCEKLGFETEPGCRRSGVDVLEHKTVRVVGGVWRSRGSLLRAGVKTSRRKPRLTTRSTTRSQPATRRPGRRAPPCRRRRGRRTGRFADDPRHAIHGDGCAAAASAGHHRSGGEWCRRS